MTGLDTPLLHPALIGLVIASLGPEHDVALPQAHGFAHPLAAAYRRSTIAPLLDELLADDLLGTRSLLQRCRVHELDEAALRADPAVAAHDPALDSLLNLNEAHEYTAARARAAPEVTVSGRGVLRAATLAAARAAAGADAGVCAATVNGRAASDP